MKLHISCDVILLSIAYDVVELGEGKLWSREKYLRIYELCEKIFLTKQDPKTLNECNSFVKAKWEEYHLYQPFPADLNTWKQQKEELKVVSF